jgi:hypothetical protein
VKRTLLFALFAVGCTDPGLVPPDQVITLTQCPAGEGPCNTIADGVSRVTVGVCVPPGVTAAAASLLATLELSAGAWVDGTASSPAQMQEALTAQTCTYPQFTTSTSLEPVHIEAQLGAVTQTLDIPLSPASISAVEIVPMATLAANADIAIDVTVRTETGGAPTAGTTLQLSVSSGGGSIYPATTVLTNTTALMAASVAAQLQVPAMVPASITVDVTATPPRDPVTGMQAAGTPESVTLTN